MDLEWDCLTAIDRLFKWGFHTIATEILPTVLYSTYDLSLCLSISQCCVMIILILTYFSSVLTNIRIIKLIICCFS